MKFKTNVDNLKYWLNRASVGLGKYYYFTVEDGLVHVFCTDGDIFTKVQTQVAFEGDSWKAFDVDILFLNNLLAYAEDDEISFDSDGTRVEIRCGDYIGSWIAQHMTKLAKLPTLSIEQPVDLSKFGQEFVQSVTKVKHAATRRIVFKNGFCYAGNQLHYQEVKTSFPEDLFFVLLPKAYDAIKFLKMNPGFELKFAETDKNLFFYDGNDVFIAPKHPPTKEDKNIDVKEDWDKGQDVRKQSYFTAEVVVLSRAIMRASLTSDKNSLSLVFDLHDEKLVISGDDSHGNHGEETILIKLQGFKKDLPIKRIAGWNFFVAALVASSEKAVTVYFDKYVGAVKSEGVVGAFTLMSKY